MKIGTDITVVARLENFVNKFGNKFLDRFLSKEEQQTLSQKAQSIAGYWAAKEAVAKALGCGIGAELGFHDIMLYKDEKQAPHFRLSERAHDGGFAIAVVVIDA